MPLRELLQPVLLPLSWLYAAAARLDAGRRRRRAYQSAFPVISVGNISAGGSGKTPLVELLAERLGRGRPILILSRGYGREGTGELLWRVGDPPADPRLLGDEPALLARSLPVGALAVGPDRARLLRRIESDFPGAIVILDDGFQHRQLDRDVDIVIVDGPTARGPHRLLPAGRLRETPSALRRADLIVAMSLSARSFAQRYVPGERIHDAGIAARGVRSLWSGTRLAHGSSVLLVTGIARPERVRQTLMELGLVVKHHVRFPDHHRYGGRSIERIERALGEHEPAHLVTTLKDSVKLELVPSLAPRLHVIDVALRMSDEERFLRAIGERVEARMSHGDDH
jgi:tetraacyldisaccharide 4'-kinase